MLTIRATTIFHGPSIWGPVPIILLDVEIGELEARLRQETPVFFDALTDVIPSLRTSRDVVSQPEGGLRRLLIDRVALALQNLARFQGAQAPFHLAGPELTYAQTHPTAEGGVYRVAYAYAHEEVGIAAGRLAVRLLNHLLANSEPDFAFTSEFETTLVPLAKRHADRWDTGAIAAAAHQRGIPVQRLPVRFGTILQLGNGSYQRRIFGSGTSATTWLGVKIADDKALTNRLLREAGLPVPPSSVVRSADEAAQAAMAIGFPVVVKPVDSTFARGTTVDIRDEPEVREAFSIARRETRTGQVVVERFIPGKDYRILVVDNQVVAVLERVAAHVIGDGMHTVAELIELTNADPRRGGAPDKPLKPITVDEHTIAVLVKQEVALDDVPEEGRFVQLKHKWHGALGGLTIDRTEAIHPDNAEIARQAAMIVGLDVAGIDVITPNIAHSVYERGGAINEVNSHPSGFHRHTHPMEGTGRDVGMTVIDMLFPPGHPVRVPIVAVAGSTDTTTIVHLIAHIMQTAGKRVGMTTTGGISINGTRVVAGEMASATAARTVLRNPAIDYAVLETASGSILRDGLGFDHCDVAVVTTVSADLCGGDGITTVEDLARVTAVVPRAVAAGGASVLNADNPYTVGIAETAGGEVLFFSMDEKNPVIRDHVRKGGRAVVLRQTPRGEMLSLLTETDAAVLLPADEIPVTINGRLPVTIAATLAATAAALAQRVPQETIRAALGSITAIVPGRPGRGSRPASSMR